MKDASDNSFYSESVKISHFKQLKEATMIVYEGLVYLVQFDGPSRCASLYCPPFDFLLDIQKIIYSEVHDKYIALKLCDVRKTKGARDHVVL